MGRALCIGLVAIACGSDEGGGSPPGTAPAGGAGGGASDGVPASELSYQPCPVATGVGEFSIALGSDYTGVQGKVEDGVNPNNVPVEVASDGDCRLVHVPTLLCDPACNATTEMCGENNQCLPLPAARDVGTVTVTGLVRPVEMVRNATTGTYRPPPPVLPYPGFVAGADLRVSASGGDYAPFELRGWGISLFEPQTEPIVVTGGQPVSFTWSAPTDPGPARVYAELNINHHGSTTDWIECTFADTGSAAIPASLVDALIARGTSGNPSISLARRTATSVTLAPGCVQLLVTSGEDYDVIVPGLVSCGDDSECPDGQTCDSLGQYCS